FLAPLLNTNTKFAVTFGNHDDEGTPDIDKTSKTDQYAYFKSKGGNNFIDHDVSSLTGVGNGVIPIYTNGQSNDTPAFQLYLMDSGSYASSGFDCPYTDQIDYYIQRSLTYPNVPSLWYQHIIVPDVYSKTMLQVPFGTPNSLSYGSKSWILDPAMIDWAKSAYGTTLAEIFRELPDPAYTTIYTSTAHRSSAAYGNKTLYESWVAYGNMLGTYYGHQHLNSFVSTTDDGIDLGNTKALTLSSLNDNNPGLRIFKLDAGGTYTTFNVTESDIVSKAMVTFDANGGTGGTGPTAMNIGTPLNAPTFTRAGYTFIAWLPSAPSIVPSTDRTYTAIWLQNGEVNENPYSIVFNGNGGSGTMSPQNIAFGQTTVLASNVFARTGYSFLGWATSATIANAYDVEYLDGVNYTMGASDVNLYAVWKPNIYEITFSSNGGSKDYISYRNYGESLAAPIVSKTGYTFTGWLPSVPATVLEGNTTYTAQWTANTYSVAYDGNGSTGGTTASSSHTYGISKELTTNGFTKTGYTFAGWATSNAGSVAYVNRQSVSRLTTTNGATVTLYAKWTVNSYMITFDANGGTGSSSTSVAYGASLTAPAVVKTGYCLAGWLPTLPSTAPSANTTFVAQWSKNNYTITFDASGGTGGSFSSMPYGSALTVPIVSKTGYTFTGWSPAVPAAMPNNDFSTDALWTANTYTVQYDGNNATAGSMSNYLHTYDVAKTLASNSFTRTGYTFAGWATSPTGAVIYANGVSVINLSSTADDTVTLYAQWTINSYTLTFDTADGSPVKAITGDFGSSISASANSKKADFAFVDWVPAIPPAIPVGDLIITAEWVELGDTNLDNNRTVLDVLMTLQKAAGKITLTSIQTLAADVNRSGTITGIDALMALQFVAGRITHFDK
ncbi:MAG: InlB B-repeat-containing protein, partial [Eubacteriales bacterium]